MTAFKISRIFQRFQDLIHLKIINFHQLILLMKYLLLAVILPAIVLSWSGILRNLDLAFYDYGFRLRPTEPIDDRIILVEWNEENLQMSDEGTISDERLASLINKIQTQEPRFIAFDIFRDIPVPSPNLTTQENNRAYERLQNIFRETPNLYGIEKVVEPKIRPPKVLKEKGQVGATDLPSDRDGIIRRGYTFPQLSKEGEPAGLPYLSVGLAGRYLSEEGWKIEMVGNPSQNLQISARPKKIIINPLKTFAGTYHDDQYGLDFLINWRKGEKGENFKRVSTTEVNSNQVPPDLFTDRLVIIGNVSSSTADRHVLPLNRWRRTDKISTYGVETFGLEIIAQVASSIISAALNGRPLMVTTPKFLNLLLYFFSLGIIIIFIDQRRNFDDNLYLSALVPTLSITGIAILGCFIAHHWGFWFPIAWLIASIWIAYLAFTFYLEQERKQNKIRVLEGFNENLLHNLSNIPAVISQDQNAIQNLLTELQLSLMSYDSHTIEDKSKIKLNIIKQLETIEKIVESTKTQNNRIRKYRETSEQFVRYCFLNVRESEKLLNANQAVSDIVYSFVAEIKAEAKRELARAENKIAEARIIERLVIIEKYDPQINDLTQINSTRGIYISSAALEIILENLLSNAIFAIKVKGENTAKQYFPKLTIQTRLNKNKIQFIIEDNGIGIPKAFQKSIFLPFKSYRNNKTHQGLGLYLTRKIANLHRGNLEVKSIQGEKSKFTLTLPLNRNKDKNSL